MNKFLISCIFVIIITVFFYFLQNEKTYDRNIKIIDSVNRLNGINAALESFRISRGYYPCAFWVNESGKHSWTAFLIPYFDVDRHYDWKKSRQENSDVLATSSGVSNLLCSPYYQSQYTNFTMVISLNYNPMNNNYQPVIIEDIGSTHHWLEPKVICFEKLFEGMNMNESSGLGGVHKGIIVILAADGKVYKIKDTTPRQILLMMTNKEEIKKLVKITHKNSGITEFLLKSI
jgi:hypothetical protein